MNPARATVYRRIALERLTSPDELADPLSITRPLDWLILVGVVLLTSGALAWGVGGTLPVTVHGVGVIWRPPGALEVAAPQAGRIAHIRVADDDVVSPGQVLLQLRLAPVPGAAAGAAPSPPRADAGQHSTQRRRHDVTAPLRGRVLDLAVSAGDQVAAGAPLLTLEPSDRPAQVVLFVPESTAEQLRPGLEVRVVPKNIPRQQYGFLKGTVSHVGRSPLTPRGMRRVLGADPLVEHLLARGLRIRVDVVMDARPEYPETWQWSSGRGPTVPLPNGTQLEGDVVLRHVRPISWILPWLQPGA